MRRPPVDAKRDANEPEVFEMLRAWGFTVYPLDTPADAIAGYGGRTFLIEVKTAKGTLTGPQIKFLETWRGDHHILRSRDDAMKFARDVRKGKI